MKPLKIIISAYSCAPNAGGERGQGWNLVRQLAQHGHEVWCLTTPARKDEIEQAIQLSPIPKLHFIYVSVPKWLDKMYPYQVGLYYHYLVWQQRAAREAKKIHKKNKVDLVHHITLASLQLGSGMWRLKIPFVYGPLGGGQFPPKAFKGYFRQWWKIEERREMASRILVNFNANTRKALREANLVFVTNSETHDLAKKYGSENTEYLLDTALPETFFPTEFPQRKPSNKLRILWVGRLFARKGLPLVLESLSKLDPNVPFTLSIIGDGPLRSILPGLVKDFKLENKVKLLGTQPWENLKEAYSNHDVFMYCSLRDSFGSQLLEAMAYGLPIITLNHQGASRFVPENASLKASVEEPQQTIQELKEAVEYVYWHPEERVQMGQNGYKFAITQTTSNKVKYIIEQYYCILEKKVCVH